MSRTHFQIVLAAGLATRPGLARVLDMTKLPTEPTIERLPAWMWQARRPTPTTTTKRDGR